MPPHWTTVGMARKQSKTERLAAGAGPGEGPFLFVDGLHEDFAGAVEGGEVGGDDEDGAG